MANEIIAKNVDDAKKQLKQWNIEYRRGGMLSRVLLNSVKYSRNTTYRGKLEKVYTFKVKVPTER